MLTFPKKVRGVERIERIKAQTLVDRARRYVEKMPPAIQGSDGSGALFAVAIALVHGFDLPEDDAWQIVLEYNTRCVPPWRESELRHKLADANCLCRHPKPRGYLRGADVEPNSLIPIPKNPERVIWEVTPEPLPGKRNPIDLQTEQAAIEGHTPTEPLEKSSSADPGDTEEKRIDGELRKLTHARAIKGPADPEAAFYAGLIKLFGATFLNAIGASGSNSNGNPPPGVFVPGKTYTPTEQQSVRIPPGLTYSERQRFLQEDLDSLNVNQPLFLPSH